MKNRIRSWVFNFLLLIAVIFGIWGCSRKPTTEEIPAPSAGEPLTTQAPLPSDPSDRPRSEWKYSIRELVLFSGNRSFDGWNDAMILQGADRIMEGELLVFSGFSPLPFSADSLDWNVSFSDSPNTFQLHLQGLGFLEALSLAAQNTGDTAYLEFGLELLKSWDAWQTGETSLQNSMIWNDHASAMRTQNIIVFALSCQGTGLDTDEFRSFVFDLLLLHGRYLAEESHYTENHNHGIIQAFSLLQIAYLIDAPESPEWIELAYDRLLDQEDFAFSSEMVHVENSSGYNLGVINMFYEISRFLENMTAPGADVFTEDVYAASEYLGWCCMPNGHFPATGDSFSAKNKRSLHHTVPYGTGRLDFALSLGELDEMSPGEKAQRTKYYPVSGYWFYREHWNPEAADLATWKSFKAGYISGTHKHSDDCSFLLYSQGYEIFLDPGMYNYVSGNPYRDYFVSSSAHNTVTVDERSYSPTTESAWKTGLLCQETSDTLDHILAFNDMYPGTEIDRHFYSSGDLTILYDDIVSEETHLYSQLFHLSEDVNLSSRDAPETLIDVADTGWHVRIRQLLPTELQVYRGREDALPLYGWLSRTMNELTAIDTLCYTQSAASAAFLTVITLEDPEGMVKLKDGSRIHYSEVLFDEGEGLLSFGRETIRPESRPRIRADAEATLSGTELALAFSPQEDCKYLFYLSAAKDGRVLYRGNYSEENEFSLDISEYAGEDLLVKAYVQSERYSQRKSRISAALLWDEEQSCFRIDNGSRYPVLNLEYSGHHYEKTGENSYRFILDYSYSLSSTQRWYVYRNGCYYTNFTTRNSDSLDYTFTEPGNYTIMYYLRTVNGDNVFCNFEQISVP